MFSLILSFWGGSLYAASAADHYESASKIYAVIICSSLVIIAMALYLFYVDRRVKKLEEDYQNESNL